MSSINQGLERLTAIRRGGMTAEGVAMALEMIAALLAERIELLESRVALLETRLAESPWACVCGALNIASSKACKQCTRVRHR